MRLSSTLFNHILETSSDRDSLPFHQMIVFTIENKILCKLLPWQILPVVISNLHVPPGEVGASSL